MGIARSTYFDRSPAGLDDTALAEAIAGICGEFEASDRTSCSKATANQVRLLVHTAAYWLLQPCAAWHPRPRSGATRSSTPSDEGGVVGRGDRAEARRQTLRATEVRLLAEQTEQATLVFPAELADAAREDEAFARVLTSWPARVVRSVMPLSDLPGRPASKSPYGRAASQPGEAKRTRLWGSRAAIRRARSAAAIR